MKKDLLSISEWCQREQKQPLLALYDMDKNSAPPSEVPFSSSKEHHFRCPVCGIEWEQSLNKLNRLKRGSYNVIKQRAEDTFCPYCRGERPSPRYNLAAAMPEALAWWDEERNSVSLAQELPFTHRKFYLKCPECGYALPKPVRLADRKGGLRCPCCGGGKNLEVTPFNCLEACYPKISQELDAGRNGGITGKMILPSYNEKLWFICPYGHRYKARVSNRTYLGRGCSVCADQQKTSFVEQAFRFYLQKCAPDLQSRQADPYTGKSVDILLSSCRTAVEFNSLYYHKTVNNGRRIKADMAKAYALAQYYRVYIIAEEGAQLPPVSHPLIEVISAPVFCLSQKICGEYDGLIFKLLKTLFPNREWYPNIDIMRDRISILQQYTTATVEGNFEEKCPLLAADWEPSLNGTLTPSMFRANSHYKFFWTCRNCKRPYSMSMANRQKVNPDTCPYCCRKSRHESSMLVEAYPFLKRFWSAELNSVPLSLVPVASEKTGVFELLDGRVVPVRISNLSAWLHAHPHHDVEQYLVQQWRRLQR